MTISIDLRLFATLQKFAPQATAIHTLPNGTTVRELINTIGIPEIKAKLIFINGIKGTLDSQLADGDRVGIFPPVGGG